MCVCVYVGLSLRGRQKQLPKIYGKSTNLAPVSRGHLFNSPMQSGFDQLSQQHWGGTPPWSHPCLLTS